MRRREVAIGLAAGLGLAAGGGFALWRQHGFGPAREAEPELWTSVFESPSGPPLAMSALAGKPLLLNFWATWCAPCVTEMPMLDAFAKAQPAGGIQVLALAIDQAEPVRRFVSERSIRMHVALGGAAGLDLSRSLGNSVNALPFTVAFAANGSVVDKKLGVMTEDLLAAWSKRLR